MSERFKTSTNDNNSKNTRLAISDDFANYRFNRDELAHAFRYLFVVERLIAIAKQMQRPLRVLDIGCGDIYIARVLQSSFIVKKKDMIAKYIGFDIDDRVINRANETKPASFDISVIQGDITTGGLQVFKDNEFDVVVCLETIEHIKPGFVPLLLSEIKRLGTFGFISTPNFDGGTGKIPKDHVKEWKYAELKREIEKAEINVVNEIGTFCNLNIVRKIAKTDKRIASLLQFLEPKTDANLLSLIMAKFMGGNAQNLLRECQL